MTCWGLVQMGSRVQQWQLCAYNRFICPPGYGCLWLGDKDGRVCRGGCNILGFSIKEAEVIKGSKREGGEDGWACCSVPLSSSCLGEVAGWYYISFSFPILLAFDSDKCHQITTSRYGNGVQPPVLLSNWVSNGAQPHQLCHEFLFMECLHPFYLNSSCCPPLCCLPALKPLVIWNYAGLWCFRSAITLADSTHFYLSFYKYSFDFMLC